MKSYDFGTKSMFLFFTHLHQYAYSHHSPKDKENLLNNQGSLKMVVISFNLVTLI